MSLRVFTANAVAAITAITALLLQYLLTILLQLTAVYKSQCITVTDYKYTISRYCNQFRRTVNTVLVRIKLHQVHSTSVNDNHKADLSLIKVHAICTIFCTLLLSPVKPPSTN